MAELRLYEERRINSSIVGPSSFMRDWVDRAGSVFEQQDVVAIQLKLLDELPKPGPQPGQNSDPDTGYREFWRECMEAKRGDTERARKMFLRDGPERFKVKEGTLRNALTRLKRAAAK